MCDGRAFPLGRTLNGMAKKMAKDEGGGLNGSGAAILGAVERGFQQLDVRFEQIDRRFEQITDRLDKIVENTGAHWRDHEPRIQALEEKVQP